jgi:hypothetical protein
MLVPMKRLVTVIGALAVLGGGVWMLQGMALLPGTFMRGNPTWIWIGAITAGSGLGLIVWGRSRAENC